MTESEKALVREWSETYPNKKLYGVPNEVFMYLHKLFPFRHCCQLFFGKMGWNKGTDYISVIPLLKEEQLETIPEDKGLGSEEFIFSDDLDL